MKIRKQKAGNKKIFEIISLEDCEKELTGQFLFLELGKHSLRMDSYAQGIDFLKDGFTISTISAEYRKYPETKKHL